MRVVDKFVRQHRVQNRFNRWSRRAGAGHLGGELVHHLRIRQRLRPSRASASAPSGPGRTLPLDCLQVPAAAFDVKDLFFLAEEIAFPDLDGGIAAAVQDQG